MLSEVKGERALTVLSGIIAPISNIAKDPEAAEIFIRKSPPEGVEPREFAMSRLTPALHKLHADHKNDLAEIISLIKGVEKEEYLEGMTIPSLIIDISGLICDDLFCSFFTFAPKDKS